MKKYTVTLKNGGTMKTKADNITELIINLIHDHLIVDFIIDEKGNKYTNIGVEYTKEDL